jgi:4-amino-4-deoxy-L-arabinose transferase-like glycosyltransferase
MVLLDEEPKTRAEGNTSDSAQPSPSAHARSSIVYRPSSLVAGILALYLILSIFYSLAIPVGEAPDEPAHVDYVQILLRTGQLPTIPVGSARFSYEAEQPPLYYLMQVGWIGLLWHNSNLLPSLEGNPDFSFAKETPYNVYLHDYPIQDAVPVYLMRFLSILVGLGTLTLIWLAAREAWPDAPEPALLALGFAALLPGFTFTSATVTNDTMAALTGAGVLYLLLRAFRRGLDLRLAALTGLVLGLGLLSKRSLLVFIPLMLLAFLLAPTKKGRIRLASISAGLATTLLIGVWPFISNVVEYGDPFATAVTRAAKGDISSPLADMPFFWWDRGYVGGLLDSLWGVFGLRNVALPGAVYLVYYLLLLAGVVFSIYYLRRATGSGRRIVLILAATLTLIYAGVAYQNTQFWAVQGRLLLPGLAALSLLIGLGLYTVLTMTLKSSRARHVAITMLLLLLLALNIYALAGRLIPAYYA